MEFKKDMPHGFTKEQVEHVIDMMVREILILGKATGLSPETCIHRWEQMAIEALQVGCVMMATAYMVASKDLARNLAEYRKDPAAFEKKVKEAQAKLAEAQADTGPDSRAN